MKKILIWLSIAGFILAPVSPIMAATSSTKLTPQEQLLRKKLLQVKVKQTTTKSRLKLNTAQAKTGLVKVKKQRSVVKQKRAAVKAKLQK